MKLKLFKKYFFTTFIIIAVSLSAMLMILSVVLNSHIAKSKQETLSKACEEVCDYIETAVKKDGSVGKNEIFQVFNSVADIADADVFATDTDGDFVPDADEAVFDGYFHESYFQSAPCFALDIDGITLLN